jgi:hypothetical protein
MVHWTTLSSGASSCLNHTCCRWRRGTRSKSTGTSFTKHDGTLHQFVCYVRQLVLRLDHLSYPHRYWWKVDVHVSMPRRCHPPRHGYCGVHSAAPSEQRIIIKQDVSYKLCLNICARSHWSHLHDGQDGCGLVLAECLLGKMTVHGQLPRKLWHQYIQQLQLFAHWFRDPLPLFSIRELTYREFELRPFAIRRSWSEDPRFA